MPILADRAARVRDRIAAAWRDAAAAAVAARSPGWSRGKPVRGTPA